MAAPRTLLLAISIGAGLALAGAGAASAATCAGKAPAAGASVHGPVLEVIDGQTLCVALGATPDRWVALKLAGTAGRSRGALMAVAFSQTVTCRVVAAGAAVCDLDGRSIAARVGESEAMRLGMAWR
jgi:hypothetical protein